MIERSHTTDLDPGVTTPADGILVSLENVSKAYPPPPPMRLRRFFSRLGGLHIEHGFAADALTGQVSDDEDEVEDDEPLDDARPQRDEPGDRLIVDGVSLQGEAGSLIALAGPGGAGKTVLLKLVGGIVAPTAGRVVVRGAVAPALSMMTLALPARGHTVKAALPQLGAMVGIEPHRVRGRFEQIAELLDQPKVLECSTSLMESRRKRDLILALALALGPDVLLLDIPIGHDAFGDACLARIGDLQDRGTLVIAEMRDLRKSRLQPDRIVLVDRGRIVPG